MKKRLFFFIFVLSILALSGCSLTNQANMPANHTGKVSHGNIVIDGSSTVYPLSVAVAEQYRKANPHVRITVSESGTGTGLARFCKGEVPIADASRKISVAETKACDEKGIGYTEIHVAMDGITVVVNKNNNWVKQLTMAQLQSIFKADSKVENWSDVPGTTNFPDEPIHLYTPGVASGTFEYFTERVNQTKNRQRTDQVTQSEDDNVLVKGVEGDKDAIGYFGYGYFEQNKQALHAVRIYDPSVSVHAIHPSPKTIMNQTYPLSRPLYLYVQSTQLQKKSVIHSFVTYYLNQATSLAKQVDMVPLTNKQLAVERTKFK